MAHALKLAGNGERFALVTSLQIEGGAARSVGSLAVVSQAGQMIGYLSNGCVDRDIMLQSIDALQGEEVKLVRYGNGSQYMDIRLPCGGSLELVIDPNPDVSLLRRAHQSLLEARQATLSFSSKKGLVDEASKQSDTKQFVYLPKPKLLLVGRGAVMLATAKLALQLDLDLHLATPDKDDLAVFETLDKAKIHHMQHPSTALDVEINAHTAVMLMFHDHEWEQSILETCARENPFFLGAMGSRKTHELRIAELMENGLSQNDCEKIRGPIGLVPSLRNASLIAVSALAEVVSALPVSQREAL